MTLDFYAILEVNPDSTPTVIKAAYRRLARKYHPDVNASKNANERFNAIAMAYKVLSDLDKRQKYDSTYQCLEILEMRKQKIKEKLNTPPGKRTASSASAAQSGATRKAQPSASYSEQVFETAYSTTHETPTVTTSTDAVADFFDSFASIFKVALKSWTPPAGKEKNRKKPIALYLSSSELKRGGLHEVEVLKKTRCIRCKPKNAKQNCEQCNGTAQMKVRKLITFELPKNAASGSLYKLPVIGESETIWVKTYLKQ